MIFDRLFGIYFKYTSTRAGEFWCDDISIFETDDPPYIENITVIDSVTLQLTFSEEVKELSAETTTN